MSDGCVSVTVCVDSAKCLSVNDAGRGVADVYADYGLIDAEANNNGCGDISLLCTHGDVELIPRVTHDVLTDCKLPGIAYVKNVGYLHKASATSTDVYSMSVRRDSAKGVLNVMVQGGMHVTASLVCTRRGSGTRRYLFDSLRRILKDSLGRFLLDKRNTN